MGDNTSNISFKILDSFFKISGVNSRESFRGEIFHEYCDTDINS